MCKIISDRLLASSSRKSYEPELDIDWEAPALPGRYHMVPKRMSLYGTPLWVSLTDDQKIELSKHEIISTARVGLWFEILLMHMIAARCYDSDPASETTQFALTEMGDETRHSVMFAKWADKYGGENYTPKKSVQWLGKFFRSVAPKGFSMWGATLVAEELLDRLQREMMRDETLQPLSQMTSRIHVLEEARHVSFAKNQLELESANSRWGLSRYVHRVLIAAAGYVIAKNLTSENVYDSVGIDRNIALEYVKNNPNYKETLLWLGEKVMPYFENQNLNNRTTRMIYRKAGLLA